MEEKMSKLIKFSQARHKSEEGLKSFVNYVDELSTEDIEEMVKGRIAFTDGPQIVNALLNGLTQKSASQKKRLKIFELLMSLIQSVDIPVRNVSTILTWLVMELEKLSSTHLLRISDICVNYVSTSKEPNHTCWKDLLPKALSIIAAKTDVEQYGSVKSGEEFKSQVVVALLQAKWETSILSSLAAMFIHISMTPEEHEQVVAKLCSRFADMEPAEVPPLVHQLLLLTRKRHTMLLFLALASYYHRFVYSLDISLNMQDSTQLEAPDAIVSTKRKDILEQQSIVLYHIEECAKRSLGCTSELIKTAKNSVNNPEVFLQPFLLSVLLAISAVPTYETQIMDLIKATIVRSIQEEEKKADSHWLRDLLTSEFDVEQVLVMLIRSSLCEQESVITGLVSLSMALLRHGVGVGGGALGRTVAHRVWTLGRMVAVNIIRKHHQVARRVLASLTDAIFNRPEVTQYTDCLAEVCDTSPLLVVESAGTVSRLLEALPDLPPRTAHKVIAAVISLTRVSLKLRDNLILVLRKSLFMHDEGTRRMAVFGFLQLLKRLKLRGLSSMSQSSFQIYTCPSLLTQTCLDVHTSGNVYNASSSNEGICLEVINILKRCFMQQASVKITLYNGMNRALLRNPELVTSVTGVFMEHFAEFYIADNETVPPLNFSKAIQTRGSEVIVVEPLGHLLYALHQVIITSRGLPFQDDDEFANNQERLIAIFDSLIKRFITCDVKHFEMDADEMTGEKEEILKEVLLVYQSLLVYLISSWNASVDIEHARTFLSVYRAYLNFENFAKSLKDGESKKRGRPAAGTQSTQLKKSNTFVLPETLFDFEVVNRLLSILLCESVDWSMEDVAAELKSKKPQYRFAVQMCAEVIQKAKTTLNEYRTKSILDEASKIGRLIFDECLKRLEEFLESNAEAAGGAIECFAEICSLVSMHFPRHYLKFLRGVCDDNGGLNTLMGKVMKVLLTNLGKVMDSEEDSTDLKKLMASIISAVSVLSTHLPVNEQTINKTAKWLLDTVGQKQISNNNDAKTLVSLLLSLLSRSKKDSTLHDNIALKLCDLFGSVNDMEVEKSTIEIAMVNDANKSLMMTALCNSLSDRLDSVNWAIIRLRADAPLLPLPCPTADKSPKTRKYEIKRREKEVVQETGLIVSCCRWICCAAVPGALGERVCKLMLQVYSTLTNLTKYFAIRASHQNPVYQEARFGKVVRLSGSNLSTQLADFILYIEAIDDSEAEKKLSKTVLKQAKKQTVYIPKLVAELENFTKCVTQLGNKCKDPNLSTNMKLTTTRDFRLNAKKLEEVLQRNKSEDEDSENDENSKENGNVSQRSQKRKASQASQPAKSQKKLKRSK